jgi:hypothetical protein
MRLRVEILEPEFAELFSREITPVKHRWELHALTTGELTSPAGLPLDVSVHCDSSIDQGTIVVKWAGAELVSAGPLRLGFQLILLLPT